MLTDLALVGEPAGGLDGQGVGAAVDRAFEATAAVRVSVASGAVADGQAAAEARDGAGGVQSGRSVAGDRSATAWIEGEGAVDRRADDELRAGLAGECSGGWAFRFELFA